MLVEPDQLVLDAIAPALRARFRVFVARSVTHAVAVAGELEGRPQVVIVDFSATTVGGGARLVRLLNWRRAQRIPVLALYRGVDARRIRRAVPVDAFARLPVDTDELVHQIASLIEEGSEQE